MHQIQSNNNNGLFRPKKYSASRQKKKKYRRLSIRRSKICDSIMNNSSSEFHPYFNNFAISYRSPTTKCKHLNTDENLFNGAGDEHTSPLLLSQQKQIDFSELERIFDSAIRNNLPVELYKEKSHTKNILLEDENLNRKSIPKLETFIENNPSDTRIEISNQSVQEPIENIQQNKFIYKIKQHKVVSAVILVTLSAMTGFLSALLFIK